MTSTVSGVAHIQWTDLLQHLQQGNGPSTRFYKVTPSCEELGQVIGAMANSKGGLIVLGIDIKNYHMTGSQLDVKELKQFAQAHIRPLIDFYISYVSRADRNLIVIQVEEAPKKPVFVDRQSYLMSTEFPFTPCLYTPPEPFHVVIGDDKNDDDIVDGIDQLHELEDVNDAHGVSEPPVQDMSYVSNAHARQAKTMAYLAHQASISNKTYRTMFDVSHKTAHIELVDLVEKGILKSQGSGRSTCYVLTKPSLN
jgi:predicted HTH transcriptional regulator